MQPVVSHAESAAPKTGFGFRPDIEGLRGIAVFLVVLYHARVPGISGGFVGVDVFFALSGYLITALLVQEMEASKRLNIMEFYARRVRRLLPASALVLLTTLIAGLFLFAPEELAFLARAARGTALYVSNIFFLRNAGDYFAPEVETNPLLHTWSLAVEEQFYLVWPWLIMLALWRAPSRKRLVVIISIVTLISLASSVWLTEYMRTWAFYGSPVRAWEFGLGGLAAVIGVWPQNLLPKTWAVIGWLGIALVLASGCFIRQEMQFPGIIALLPVTGTVLALVCGARIPDSTVGTFLNIRPLQFLGKMSYSWYLWHWPILVCAAAVVPSISWQGRLLCAFGGLGVAAITHKLIEDPIRFHRFLKPRPLVSLALAALLTTVSFGAALLALRWAGHIGTQPSLRPITAAAEDNSTYPDSHCFTLSTDPTVKPCTFGKADSAFSIAIFGDSHAAVWFGPIRQIAEERGWRLVTFLKSGCPAASIVFVHPTLGSAFSKTCTEWREEAIRQIVNMHPAVVFIANSTSTYLAGKDDRGASNTRVSFEAWREGTRKTLEALSKADSQIDQLRDNPSANFNIPTCLERATLHSWYPKDACVLSRETALVPAIFEAEREAAQGMANVHFIDLSDQFCQEKICMTVKDGMILYQDAHHISSKFAAKLRPLLELQLVAAMQSVSKPIANFGDAVRH